jgi:hypothetical protein
MKKFNLCLTLIAVVMLVGLTNCKKDTENTSVTKYVGTVNGSFIAQDASIKINKDLDPSLLITRNWIMYAKNSPFYGNQPFALVKGKEFITGSAAQQWWSKDGNNPVSFAASQAVYSNLTPAEPVRLIMEGYGSDNSILVAYLGILDFDPTAAQFPLAVTSKSLGDKLIVNADGLTKLPGGDLISITATFQAATVNLQATETKLQLSSGLNEGQQTGVTGSLDFSDIVYNTPEPYYLVPVKSGDCVVFSESASKIQGTITLTITFAPSPSAPGVSGGSTTLTVPAAGPGQYRKIVLSTPKLGWYDSATIGVSDNDISVDVVNVSVDGQQNNQGGGDQGGNQGGDQGGQTPPVTNIILNAFNSSVGTGSVYQIYNGPANAPEVAQLGIFLAVYPPNYMTDGPLAHAYVYNTGTPYGKQMGNGEIKDMGAGNQLNTIQAPPTTGFSFYTALVQGNTYVVRFRKVLDYQTSLPLPSSYLDYIYGIFYVTGYQSDGVTITYEGPFDPNQQ